MAKLIYMPLSLLPEDEDGPGPEWLGEESEEDTDGDTTDINQNSV